MFIDTHTHLNFKDFNKDRDEVIRKSLKQGVWLINASSTFDTSKLAVEIAEKYDKGVYAAIGLHPIHISKEEFVSIGYRQLAQSNKVVAIGETGLDYMYPEKEKQKQVFLEHLQLAKELDLPVILHCRKAHDDMIITLRRSDLLKFQGGQTSLFGVVHCFTGKWSEAKKYLDLGLHLGFNGIIFKYNVDETIKKMPLERILLETDCPYLIPPEAGTGRNEPLNIKYIAHRIANLRNESIQTIAQTTTQNAKQLFNI